MKKIFFIVFFVCTGAHMTAQTTLNRALQLLQEKNYVPAIDICNSLLTETPGDPSALAVRSQIYTVMGKNDLAEQDADKALSVDNTSDRANYAKAEALYYGKRDYGQALTYYDAAIKSNAQMPEAYAGKARALMNLQNYKDALKIAEDAITSFPKVAELYYVCGLLEFQRGKPKYAVESYDKAQSIDPKWNTYQVLLNRGIANDALMNFDLALKDYTGAIAADPNNSGGYIARANMQYNLSKYREAIEDFKKAEVLSPDNSVLSYNIGMAYYRGEDRATACRYFQKSCSQGNQNACKMMVLNCTNL